MTYEDKDELAHAPAEDPWWQESVVVTWWDEAAGIGGTQRIGHEVGQENIALWNGLVTAEGTRFRSNPGDVPLTDADRLDDGFAAGDGISCRFDENGPHWSVRQPGCELDLRISDFYPMTNLWTLGTDSLTLDFAPNHFEASGRVRGTAVLDGKSYDVDGLCHRDHSWGVRRWDSLRTHRWVTGSFGPDLSFGMITWLASDGSLTQGGYVHRDGEVQRADDVDVVVYLERDGATHRGGWATWRLPDGYELRIDCEVIDGVLFEHRGVADIEGISRARTPDGRLGFCDFETTNNSRLGKDPVPVVLRAYNEEGVGRRP